MALGSGVVATAVTVGGAVAGTGVSVAVAGGGVLLGATPIWVAVGDIGVAVGSLSPQPAIRVATIISVAVSL
jgi:hypothetical protein